MLIHFRCGYKYVNYKSLKTELFFFNKSVVYECYLQTIFKPLMALVNNRWTEKVDLKMTTWEKRGGKRVKKHYL